MYVHESLEVNFRSMSQNYMKLKPDEDAANLYPFLPQNEC